MQISIIVAMDNRGVIGINDRLPWKLSADLQHFKALTMGKPIIMGRKTHESIGRPLPGRENIVITRDRDYRSVGCTILNSLEEAFRHCAMAKEVMIMGGAELYRQTLNLATRIYLTEVHTEVPGDIFFPKFNWHEWREIKRKDFLADEKNEYNYSFVVLKRK